MPWKVLSLLPEGISDRHCLGPRWFILLRHPQRLSIISHILDTTCFTFDVGFLQFQKAASGDTLPGLKHANRLGTQSFRL
jgi:hypothetical protein